MTMHVVQRLFDSWPGQFDDMPGLFDDERPLDGAVALSLVAAASSIGVNIPDRNGTLALALSGTATVTVVIQTRTDDIDIGLEGTAVRSYEKDYGTQGAFSEINPPAQTVMVNTL